MKTRRNQKKIIAFGIVLCLVAGLFGGLPLNESKANDEKTYQEISDLPVYRSHPWKD